MGDAATKGSAAALVTIVEWGDFQCHFCGRVNPRATPRELTDENFEKWASEIGLDVAKFKEDMKDKALEEKVKKMQTQGSTLGARGTPAFFINGRFLSGARPFEAFEAVIDEELGSRNWRAEVVGRGAFPVVL